VASVSEAAATRVLPVAWRKGLIGEMWAEFLGTFVLIAFGDGVVAMLWALVGSGRSSAGPLQSSGDWLLIAWGWGFAVVFGIWVAGGISGAHINPAISLSLAVRRQFPWAKVIPYWVAQVAGAFVGAALVYGVYNAAISDFETTHHIIRGAHSSIATYSTFATFPAPYFHTWVGPFVDQVVGTFFLAFFVFAVLDEVNLPVGANLAPLIVGFIVVAIGISYGANAGYAINPARDFGPRMLAFAEGWKKIAFPGDYGNINDYFWIPIVGPLVGAAVAGLAWDGLVRPILIARKEPEPGVQEVGRTVQRAPEEQPGS
jgi:glycerol uptake facilitator protein